MKSACDTSFTSDAGGRVTRAGLGLCVLNAAILLCASACAADEASQPAGKASNPKDGEQPAAASRAETPALGQQGVITVSGIKAADFTFNSVLYSAVNEHGLVDYDELERPTTEENLERVVQIYGEAELPEDADARTAFWCNAYNANVLLILHREQRRDPELRDVLSIEGFFDQKQIKVGREIMVLNDLEHKKLRPLGDPRIHAALVCGAVSCPPLRREAFEAARLDAQLDDQSRRWINDASKNHVEAAGLSISMILDWFKDDFIVEPFGGRIGFVRQFAAPGGPIDQYLKTNPEPVLLFEPYDWRINDAKALDPISP